MPMPFIFARFAISMAISAAGAPSFLSPQSVPDGSHQPDGLFADLHLQA
jgi:hypothetical protein